MPDHKFTFRCSILLLMVAVILALVFAKGPDPITTNDQITAYPKFVEDVYNNVMAFVATIQINAILVCIVLVYTIVLVCVFMNFKNSKDDPQKDEIMEPNEN